jgi:hypothetical protein
MPSIKRGYPGVQGELMPSIKRGCPGVQGELMPSIKRGCPAVMGQALDKKLSYLKRQKFGQSLNYNKSQISLLPEERAPPVDS